MSRAQDDKPVVAVVTASGEPMPPGLEALEGEAELRQADDRRTLERVLPAADIVLVTDFRTDILPAAWPLARRVSWVHATSAGVDALMFPGLIASDIPVTNARGIFDRPIAEYVLGMILLFAKDFHGSLSRQRERRWQHRDSERIEGAHAVVVGAGSIGATIARSLRAQGLRVTGTASRARQDPDFDEVRAAEDLFELLPQADYVVVAAPLTQATRGLFGREAFRRMRDSARLINVGRGPIVDTEALIAALEQGEIAGAGLDVFETEPLPAEHPLWDTDQVVITAHRAGDFIGWREALSQQFIDNFRRWRDGRALVNLVDKQKGYAGDSSQTAGA